jgi:hypothetical protein
VTRDLLTYLDLGGVLTRRGRFDPPPPPEIVTQDFENLATANPISAADFRVAIQDSTFGDYAIQRANMQVVDLGGAEGKVIRVTYPATYYTGGATGVAYSTIKISRNAQWFSQKFRLRFGTGFETAKGGKIGPGIGGYVTTTTFTAPNHSSLTAPPSGGNSSPYGWSARGEWGADGKIHEILYLPGRARYDGVTVYGIGRNLAIPAHTKGVFFDYERRIKLNTAFETDPNVDPRDLVLGSDYLADGVHQVLVDDVPVYTKNDEVWRFYEGAWAKNLLWSWFRGGGDSTWSATTGGSYADLAWHELLELTA